MWIFGYGTLISGQRRKGRCVCTQRSLVDLDGYRRIFNKVPYVKCKMYVALRCMKISPTIAVPDNNASPLFKLV